MDLVQQKRFWAIYHAPPVSPCLYGPFLRPPVWPATTAQFRPSLWPQPCRPRAPSQFSQSTIPDLGTQSCPFQPAPALPCP